MKLDTVHVLYGEDEFSLQEALDDLRASLADDMLSTNTTFFEGARASVGEIIDAASALPFLGQHRLVIAEGLLHKFDPPSERRGSKAAPDLGLWQGLVDYVQSIPPSTVLALTDGPLSQENSLLKALKPSANVRRFPALKPRDLPSWIGQRAKKKGIAISQQAVRSLADAVGGSLRTLDQELEKLATYASGRPVTEADIKALAPQSREESVFALTDAVAAGKAEAALILLSRLLDQEMDASQILRMLARQYRSLLIAREAIEKGEGPSDLGRQLGIYNSFVLEKIQDQARRYTFLQLKAAYRRLLAADLAIKRGQESEDLALTLLVSDLATGETVPRSA